MADGSREGLQLGLFDREPTALERAVEDLDLESTTPIEAPRVLQELKDLL